MAKVNGPADQGKVSRQLLDAGADGVGRGNQIVEQRVRAQGCGARDRQRQVWRETLALRGGDHGTVGLARHSVVWLETLNAKTDRREQRFHVVAQFAQRRREYPQVARRDG